MASKLDFPQPDVPTPVIYLRDRFTVDPLLNEQFLCGKENLIRHTVKNGADSFRLIAGCGEKPPVLGSVPTGTSPILMQIWQIGRWEALYNTMYEFSETSW